MRPPPRPAVYPPEVALLLVCTRQHVTDEQAEQVRTLCQRAALDWARLATIAQAQGIAPLFWTNLQKVGPAQIGLPAPIAQALQQATYQNIAVKAGIVAKLAAIIAFCQPRGIDVMAIKGMALDLLVYDQPWYTINDVDLVLRAPEGVLSPAIVAEVERFFWPLPGFEYEFATHHDVTMNGVLRVDFAHIWAKAAQICVRDQPLWVMDPVHLLITACINSGRKRFFRLKQLLAIASLLAHYPSLDGRQVAEQARAFGCTNLVYAALRAAQATVGCTLPAGLIEQLEVHSLRAQLIDHLIGRATAALDWQHAPKLHFHHRALDASLLLPYVTYTPAQLVRKARYLWQERAA